MTVNVKFSDSAILATFWVLNDHMWLAIIILDIGENASIITESSVG